MKTEDQAVTAGHTIGPARWQDMFEALMGRIAGCFAGWNRDAGHGSSSSG
nr:hypothetical protein [Streptomyces regalis]